MPSLVLTTLAMFLYVALSSPHYVVSFLYLPQSLSLIGMLLATSNNAVLADIMCSSLPVSLFLSLVGVRVRGGLQEVPKRVHVQYG